MDDAAGADPVEQQRQPGAAAEPDVGHGGARIGPGRVHRGSDHPCVGAIEPGADDPSRQALRMTKLAGEPGEEAGTQRHAARS